MLKIDYDTNCEFESVVNSHSSSLPNKIRVKNAGKSGSYFHVIRHVFVVLPALSDPERRLVSSQMSEAIREEGENLLKCQRSIRWNFRGPAGWRILPLHSALNSERIRTTHRRTFIRKALINNRNPLHSALPTREEKLPLDDFMPKLRHKPWTARTRHRRWGDWWGRVSPDHYPPCPVCRSSEQWWPGFRRPKSECDLSINYWCCWLHSSGNFLF